MGRKQIDVRARSAAPPEVVFAVLKDRPSWPEWSGHDEFTLEQPGEGDPNGLGAVGVFRSGRTRARERIVELVPDQRLGYVLVDGMPLRDYRADVELTPVEGGTEIRWRSSFEPARPGTGWFYRLALQFFIRRAAKQLAARAEAEPFH